MKPDEKLVTMGCLGFTYKSLVESGKFKRVMLIPEASFPDRPWYSIKERLKERKKLGGKGKKRNPAKRQKLR